MAEQTEKGLSGWLSTYGLITAQRIYEYYNIHLSQEDLIYTLKTPGTFYHRLLNVPFNNVFNGIILQQAADYQRYAQKLFVDYLVSGDSGKSPDSPGAGTREDLENQRLQLMELNAGFHKLEVEHEKLIAESQSSIIKCTADWQNKIQTLSKNVRKKLSLNAAEQTVINAMQNLLVEYNVSGSEASKNYAWSKVEKTLSLQLPADARALITSEMGSLMPLIEEMDANMASYTAQVKQIGLNLRQYRSDLYDFIIRANELFSLLPDYRPDPAQTLENRESLHFDMALGDEEK